MSHIMRKLAFEYAKTKQQISCAVISCAVTAQLISAFVFAAQIVQSLFFLNPKFKPLAIFCGCTAWFVSDLVRNPENRFSHNEAHISGSFGEWMSCHPECLGCAIPLLLQGIGNPEVAMPATMALKDVTRENLDHIRPYIQQILTACKVGLFNVGIQKDRVRHSSS